MHIEGFRPGATYAPLDQITLLGAETGTLVVTDARGRPYARLAGRLRLAFVVGGAAGYHTIARENGDGTHETLTFRVAARTHIHDAGGEFKELLQMLYYTMITDSEMDSVRWNGRIYRFFVRWLRDHVHVLKGMKYFAADLHEGIDLYRESQRADGMIWDNVYPRNGPNYWDVRFAEGDFIEPFADGSAEFKRIPVEADVEYLFVEGLYYTWKATADDGWMADALDAAIHALEYCVTDPYRWSELYQLIKRGHTIDTWDFQDEQNSVVAGDPMRVDPARTRFGVMFGDNTGYIAACRYLAEMLEHAGRASEAARYRERAAAFQQRLDALSWNGRFFTHHVPEDLSGKPDLGVDESTQVSLSNAYSLNRGIAPEQAQAIIATYQHIRDELPEGAPGEWYTIFPPFQRGYGGHNSLWQYMNAGVTPIVAGELAHGAFEHGAETYGADILRRLAALGRQHGGRFHAVYTGAAPAPKPARYLPIDIRSQANIDTNGAGAPGVPGWTGEGENDLHELPGGLQTLAGIPFALPDPEQNGRRACIGLRRREGYAERVSIPICQYIGTIYLLHCVSQTGPGGVGGLVTLHYTTGEEHRQYIVRGQNVSGWWFPEAPEQHGQPTVKVAWRGKNAMSPDVGLVAYALENPHPDKVLERIELTAAEDGAFWAVCGVTVSNQPPDFPPNPISYGIPNNWAAAAVVYALIEGLAGVVDRGTGYSRALLAPRWIAAGVDAARATVHYPASDGYVAYTYRHDAAQRRIELELTGSGEACVCHLLLPAAAQGNVTVRAGDAEVAGQTSGAGESRYVDFELALPGPHRVVVSYA